MCTLSVQVRKKQVLHYVRVVPNLQVSFSVGEDLLVRFGAQLDMVNQVLWSLAGTDQHPITVEPEHIALHQAILQACQVASKMNATVPP